MNVTETHTTVVSATVVTDDPKRAVAAAEVLADAVANLGRQGIDVSLSIGHPDEDETED